MKDSSTSTTLEAPLAHQSARPATLKRINMRRFLDELRRLGPSTRADLSRVTGVAAPTSSNIIADLLEIGFLEQTETRIAAKGRPGKVFRLAADSAYVIGGTIDVEECVLAPAGLDGIPRRDDNVRFETPQSYEGLLDAICDAVESLRAKAVGRCMGLGLSVPGLVDERLGKVAFSPNLHFTDDKSLGPDLALRLGIEVVCTQEEHALCLAEQIVGEAKTLSDFIALDLTSGMGMGVVSSGRYISGRDGFAGEIGHTTVEPNGQVCGCGNRGCLETVATDSSFLHAVRGRLGTKVGFDEVAAMVEQGYLDVSKELDSTLSYISIALATLVNLFNPEAIVLNGKVLDLRPDSLEVLSTRMSERALAPSMKRVRLLRSKGDKLQGALAGLLDQVFAAVGPKLAYGED